MTSDDRLRALARDRWTVETVNAAIDHLLATRRVEISLLEPAKRVPALHEGTRRGFRYGYASSPEPGDEVAPDERIAIAEDAGKVIGFALLKTDSPGDTLEIVDVHEKWRRSSNISNPLDLAGSSFHVGLGHALVRSLLSTARRPVGADATTPASRFIFRSLGFVNPTGELNPCLLVLH